jgi:uncharacterized protein YxjI
MNLASVTACGNRAASSSYQSKDRSMAALDSYSDGDISRAANSEPSNFERYRAPQNVAALQGRILVRNDRGRAAFAIDCGLQLLADVVRVRTLAGDAACLIQGGALLSGESVAIVDADQKMVAAIERVELSPVRDCFAVHRGADTSWRVNGRVADYEYRLWEHDLEIAEISRRWFRARDSFGVQVAAGQPDLLVVTVAVCLDLMLHAGR